MKGKTKIKSPKLNLQSGFLKNTLVGTMIAVCVSLILVLVFAFMLKFTNIPDSAIKPVNQIIKGVSVFVGVFIGLKKTREMGLVSGLLIGFIYTILAFLIFSVLSGHFVFDISIVTDMVFGAVIGAICGIICVNIKKSGN